MSTSFLAVSAAMLRYCYNMRIVYDLPGWLSTFNLAPSTGFEPVTNGVEIRCSIQLSHEGNDAWHNPAS